MKSIYILSNKNDTLTKITKIYFAQEQNWQISFLILFNHDMLKIDVLT